MKKLILRRIIKMLEKLKAKIEKPKNPALEHAYTDNIGNLYYVYKINKLPYTRYVFLQGVLNQLAMGIEAKELSTLLDKIATSVLNVNIHDIDKFKQTTLYDLENIKQRTRNILQMDLLIQAALCITALEGEPNEYSEFWNAQKLEMWQKDNDAKFFFVHLSLTTIRGFQNISLAELKAYAATNKKSID